MKKENKRQLIVNEGIIYNKRNIFMLIRDLGYVKYYEVVGKKVVRSGEGCIMRVCNSETDPTLFLNGRIYINIFDFDYLQARRSRSKDNTVFELHRHDRIISLLPDDSPKNFSPTPRDFLADRIISGELTGESEPEDLPENFFEDLF